MVSLCLNPAVSPIIEASAQHHSVFTSPLLAAPTPPFTLSSRARVSLVIDAHFHFHIFHKSRKTLIFHDLLMEETPIGFHKRSSSDAARNL